MNVQFVENHFQKDANWIIISVSIWRKRSSNVNFVLKYFQSNICMFITRINLSVMYVKKSLMAKEFLIHIFWSVLVRNLLNVASVRKVFYWKISLANIYMRMRKINLSVPYVTKILLQKVILADISRFIQE